jgi:hypothetical protein
MLALAVSWALWTQGGKPEVCLAGEPLSVRPLGPQEGQGQVQALDFAVPSFGFGSFAAPEQVGLDLVQAAEHPRVDVQDGASQVPCSCWHPVP